MFLLNTLNTVPTFLEVGLYINTAFFYVNSVCFPGPNGAQPTKGGVGRNESERKGRDSCTHITANHSDNRRKRPYHSSPENTPPQTRRQQLEVFRHREDSLSGSSDSASDSEAEEDEEEDKEEEWEHNGKRLKTDAGASKKNSETGKVRNGRAVIQQLKSVVTSTSSSNVKTEQEMLSTGVCSTTGGRWSNTQSARGINGSSPPSQDSESVTTEAPAKGLFSPPSPISASPLPREDRLHGGRTPDYELLQRLAAGGAAGRVLFHPLALGPPGPQSLYAPSTIRYAPPELPTAHAEGPRLDHAPKSPTFFPHLQRIAALPPFSGFSPSEPPFAPSLPFCMNGLRGAAGTDED